MIPSILWTTVLLLLSPFVHGAVLPKADGGKGHQVIKAKYNHAYKPSRHALTRALRKWQLRTGTDVHNFAMKGEIANVTSTPTDFDREWVTSVGFGTPAQWIPMDLDTGSADVWVFSDLMDPKKLLNRTYYRPEQSTTAAKVANSSWQIQYGDSSSAAGEIYTDTINLGGVNILNAAVEAATAVSSSMLSDYNICGVFGLPYKLPSQTVPSFPTVLQDLTSMLDQKVFTVDLRYQANGEYHFGYIDSTKYLGEIEYVPLVADGGDFWNLEYTLFTSAAMPAWHSVLDRKAIVDTGTSLLLLPDDVVSKYYNGVKGAVFLRDVENGAWFYPCDVDLPSFSIGFSKTGATYEIPGKYMRYAEDSLEAGEGMCMGGLQVNTDIDFGILGDIFLKSVFAVFDFEQAAVGFAQKPLDL